MTEDLLEALRQRLEDDLDGITLSDGVLVCVADARWGELAIVVEHEAEAEALRVSTRLPPPAGAGTDFLVFCLATNTQYWDAKVGLDDEGELCVHADVDVGERLDELATCIVDRVDSILELVDEDLVDWLLEHGLGTPAQRARWQSRAPSDPEAS